MATADDRCVENADDTGDVAVVVGCVENADSADDANPLVVAVVVVAAASTPASDVAAVVVAVVVVAAAASTPASGVAAVAAAIVVAVPVVCFVDTSSTAASENWSRMLEYFSAPYLLYL